MLPGSAMLRRFLSVPAPLSRHVFARRVAGPLLAASAGISAGAAFSLCDADGSDRFPKAGTASSPLAGRTSLHRVDPNLAGLGHADAPRPVKKLHDPKKTHVVRIALTGGPCAGKSSALAMLTDVATSRGFDVYVAPETATVLFNCGFSFPDPGDPEFDRKVFAFQKNLFKMQLQVERSMTGIAQSTGRPSIVVFDRGLLDGKGYMSADLWSRVLASIDEHRGVTEEYCLGRYDGIIHLITAADGAPSFYRCGWTEDDEGRPTYRQETPEEAIVLDKKMQEVWHGHSRHVVIHNGHGGGFKGKLKIATEAMIQIASEAHPAERMKADKRASEV